MSNAKIKARLAELERQLGINQPCKPQRAVKQKEVPVVITFSSPDRFTGKRLFEIKERDTGRVIHWAEIDKGTSVKFELFGYVEAWA